MKHQSSKDHRFAHPIAWLFLGLMLLGAPCLSAEETLHFAVADTGVVGILSTGDLAATHELDGSAQKLAEAKDESGNYRLQWQWHFGSLPAADSHQLRLTAQATNSKHGMDFYEFQFRVAQGDWQTLGTAGQTTMSSYAWNMELSGAGGDVTVRAVDTNRVDDPRRSNQLWLDQLAIAAIAGGGGGDDGGTGGGGGGTGGGGGGSDMNGPATDKIIAGYYPSWGIYNARKYWVRYIPFDRISHVYYAFANLDPNTYEVIIGDAFAELTNRKDPETDYGLPAGNLNQLTHYRDVGHNGPAYGHLKVIISVGGWSWSAHFSDAALTPQSRWRFASSLRDFIETHDLDGADIDWEFPTGDPNNCGLAGNGCRAEDPLNHALLLMACRIMLGDDKELSIAMPAGAHSIAKILPALVNNDNLNGKTIFSDPSNPGNAAVVTAGVTPTAAEMLDYVHIMNYDHVGAAFEDTTRHHAPLFGYESLEGDPAENNLAKQALTRYNGHFAVSAYQHLRTDYADFDPDAPGEGPAGIPADKLTLGIPMYGRGFQSVEPGDWEGFEGLFRFTDASERRRTPKGTWDGGKWGNTGVFAYWDLLLGLGGDAEQSTLVHTVAPPTTERFYGSYLLNGDLFVGFDNLRSVDEKVQYVVDEDLAGIMFWDFPGDISQAQVDQGIAGAEATYPAKSLIHRIAEGLEAAATP
jgi:chitinase